MLFYRISIRSEIPLSPTMAKNHCARGTRRTCTNEVPSVAISPHHCHHERSGLLILGKKRFVIPFATWKEDTLQEMHRKAACRCLDSTNEAQSHVEESTRCLDRCKVRVSNNNSVSVRKWSNQIDQYVCSMVQVRTVFFPVARSVR